MSEWNEQTIKWPSIARVDFMVILPNCAFERLGFFSTLFGTKMAMIVETSNGGENSMTGFEPFEGLERQKIEHRTENTKNR